MKDSISNLDSVMTKSYIDLLNTMLHTDISVNDIEDKETNRLQQMAYITKTARRNYNSKRKIELSEPKYMDCVDEMAFTLGVLGCYIPVITKTNEINGVWDIKLKTNDVLNRTQEIMHYENLKVLYENTKNITGFNEEVFKLWVMQPVL